MEETGLIRTLAAYPGDNTRYTTNRSLRGPQSQSGRFWEGNTDTL